MWRPNGKGTLALLLCGFSLIIILMIAITYQSFSQLKLSKSRLDNIVLVHNQKSALIGAMQYANRERVISLQHMLITEDFFELDEAAQNNMSMANRFVQARGRLEAMERAPGEEALLADLRRAASIGAPLNDKVRDLLWNDEDNAHERARAVLIGEFLPAQNQIYDIFERLIDLYEAENSEAVRNSAEGYTSARGLILKMLQATVLLGVATALSVTMLILKNERALKSHRNTLESIVAERTSELRRISTEAVMARRDAEEANNAKSTFMANMSHELRTPLNAVLGFSEIMDLQLMGPMPEVYREYPKHINCSAHHLLQMIQQLLDLSRIEAGHLEIDDREIWLPDLMEETVAVIRSAFSRDDRTLYITADSLALQLNADERLLKQVLINIISNAAKYSDTQEMIELTVSCIDGNGVIEVRDYGMGIAAEELPRLFNPYERSEAQTARAREGTGLGLAISRSLVEAHGGTLTLDSVLNEGTTVTIILPAHRILRVEETRPEKRAASV